MSNNIDKQAAEHLRKAIKEMRWSAYNLEKYYNLVKPEDAPIITIDKNQLTIFDEIENYEKLKVKI